MALTGNNGCGKSTLMRIIAGDLSATTGTVSHPEHLYYVPQHFGQYDDRTIAQALRIDGKLEALHAILNGDVSERHFTTLNDDWNIEERDGRIKRGRKNAYLPRRHGITFTCRYSAG